MNNNSNTDFHEHLPGGKGDGKNPKDFNPDQLEKGVKHEREHTNDNSIAEEIAIDHLVEDPKYYDHLVGSSKDKHSRLLRLSSKIANSKHITDFYPGSYTLSYKPEIWDKVRHHPLFIEMVEESIQSLQDQIQQIKAYQGDHPEGLSSKIQKAVGSFTDYQKNAKKIAEDTGFKGDWQDIIISLQRHPITNELMKKRELLKKKRDNFEVI